MLPALDRVSVEVFSPVFAVQIPAERPAIVLLIRKAKERLNQGC